MRTRLYGVWNGMKQRCGNPKSTKYSNYGGKGIAVCKEWADDFKAFEKWAFANGYDENAQKGECTIDRIDSNKNYCPENCRIALVKVQNNNTSRNMYLEYRGETKTTQQWCDELGLSRYAVQDRLHKLGWSVEKALSTPVPTPKRAKRKMRYN